MLTCAASYAQIGARLRQLIRTLIRLPKRPWPPAGAAARPPSGASATSSPGSAGRRRRSASPRSAGGRTCPALSSTANPDARAAVAAPIAQAGEQRTRILDAQDDEREATWRERALNAEGALKAAHAEILARRTRIGELLGQVRDLQSEWTQEAIQRITTENTTLKQRVRTLTADNRVLEEKLKAARESLRFHDKRIADLEAQFAPPE